MGVEKLNIVEPSQEKENLWRGYDLSIFLRMERSRSVKWRVYRESVEMCFEEGSMRKLSNKGRNIIFILRRSNRNIRYFFSCHLHSLSLYPLSLLSLERSLSPNHTREFLRITSHPTRETLGTTEAWWTSHSGGDFFQMIALFTSPTLAWLLPLVSSVSWGSTFFSV